MDLQDSPSLLRISEPFHFFHFTYQENSSPSELRLICTMNLFVGMLSVSMQIQLAPSHGSGTPPQVVLAHRCRLWCWETIALPHPEEPASLTVSKVRFLFVKAGT